MGMKKVENVESDAYQNPLGKGDIDWIWKMSFGKAATMGASDSPQRREKKDSRWEILWKAHKEKKTSLESSTIRIDLSTKGE